MAVYTCKMCGGKLKPEEGSAICTCEYCKTRQTLPLIDDEQAANRINRAHHFRQLGEFDKAADTYTEMIAIEGGSGMSLSHVDSELFWSLALCRYGIEYVTDPVTHQGVATCHRVQYKSILDDSDYLQAVDNADPLRRAYYEQEAQYIASVQKRILEISEREEPFDVFLCYKETDADGKRTKDSVLAQEMYYQLTKEGFKVFFARITLEGKLGTEYEPYIFAALHSARTMVVIGTEPAYFNAPWVKNEWARFLSVMKEEGFRSLIVAYKDMNPYDIPDALSMYPAQDMGELGFLQDLTRGIRKLSNKEEELQNKNRARETVVITSNSNVEPLLKRVGMFMEDGDFASAMEYCEKTLDIYPECAQAYLYLVLAKRKIKTVEQLGASKEEFDLLSDRDFQKVLRFGDEDFKKGMLLMVREKEYSAVVGRYERFLTVELERGWNPPEQIRELIERFRHMDGYKDSDAIVERLERKYTLSRIHEAAQELKDATSREELLAAASRIRDIEDLRRDPEFMTIFGYPQPEEAYHTAVQLMHGYKNPVENLKAARMFAYLTDYRDSAALLKECVNMMLYTEATKVMSGSTAADCFKAIHLFNSLGNFEDAPKKAAEAKEKWQELVYSTAVNTMECARTPENLEKAVSMFESLGDYRDSEEKAEEAKKSLKKMIRKINKEGIDPKGGDFMMKKWL